MSVKAFLEGLRPVKPSKILRFVTGNQSADMDSVICAISYAYFHHQSDPQAPPLLPLVNISREELRLRRDIELLLKTHQITERNLFFLEDVETFAETSFIEVILVDHCNLQGNVLNALYKEKRLDVVGIIDHHADEEVFKDANPRIIRSNGSCSALVFNYWYEKLGKLSSNEIVLMLLGPLLIDTSNMTQKVEQGDIDAFKNYMSLLESSPIQTEIFAASALNDDFYKTLKTAKKDLSGFLLFDILRKDYKLFAFTGKSCKSVNIGFSSLGKSMSWILEKFPAADVVKTFDTMAEVFKLDVVLITTSYTKKENNEYTREFCYYAANDSLDSLGEFATGPLKLNDKVYGGEKVAQAVQAINESRFFKVYNQVRIEASRKQVVPVVKAVVEADF